MSTGMRPRPPLAKAAIRHSRSVPSKKETNAACSDPIVLPKPELIGACRAIAPPTIAVSSAAVPRSIRASLRFEPVRSDAGIDRQRRIEVRRGDHLAARDLLRRLHLLRRPLEEQLVVDLEDEPGLEARRGEGVVAAHHRHLD